MFGQVRQLFGRLDIAHLLGVALGEDDVDLLQTATCRLRVEEVDDGEEHGVEDGEEQICAPATCARVVYEHGCDHDDEEIPKPVADCRAGSCLGTGLERVDLGRVEPRQG